MKENLHKIFLLLIVLSINLSAQNFTVSVDRTTIQENEAFEISFSAKGKDINGFGKFTPPEFENFRVLSGPVQSSNMSIINGVVSSSISYSYYLQPRSTGNFTIDAATIEYKGKPLKTKPISVTVVDAPEPPAPEEGNSDNKNTAVKESKSTSSNLFVRAFPDKQKVYQGEQIIVSYKIYTRENISAPNIAKAPSFTGFWNEDVEIPRSIVLGNEMYDGKQYSSGVFKKMALFPTRTGKLTVDPLELSVNVAIKKQRKRNNDIFDDFFNDPFFGVTEMVEKRLIANSFKIDVLPLPENAPESFTGAVGNFSFRSEIDRKSGKVNEPITIKLTVSGTGNIELVEIPELKVPAGFEKYEPKINKSLNRNGKISGTKSIEYLLVPRASGIKEIPSVEFSYFDPLKKQYIKHTSENYVLNIEKGDGSNDQTYAYGKEDVSQLGNDIRFIKTTTADLSRTGGYIINSIWFWIASVFPALILIGAVIWKNRTEKLAGNMQLLKYQKAEKFAKNQLNSAKISLDNNQQEAFYTNISLALFGYLENKLNISKSEFTVLRAVNELQNKDVPEDLSMEVKKTLEYCEFARFAPQSGSESAMNEMYNKAVTIIMELEKYLSNKKIKKNNLS